MALVIKQGDAYNLEINLTLNGAPITEENLSLVETVEIYLADEYQEYRSDGNGTVIFSNGVFLFPLTQEQTLALREGPLKMDIRIKDVSGEVHGLENKIPVTIKDAISRRVL